MAEHRALGGGRSRVVAGLLAVALVSTLVPGAPASGSSSPPPEAVVSIAPRPQDPNAWLALVNWWRSFGGGVDGSSFPTVTNQPADNTGPQNHASYLTSIWAKGSSYCGHGQDGAFPKDPAVNYSHNVLVCGADSIGEAIDIWDNTPYHAPPLLAPSVTRVGAGFATFGSQTASAAGTAAASPIGTTYLWPRDGGLLPRTSMRGGESPDPTALCPPEAGQRPGQSVFAWFPESRVYLGATLRDGAGDIPFCILSNPFASAAVAPGEARSTYVVFSKRPYTVGSTVTASITTSRADGSDQRTTTWSFGVADTPASGLASVQAIPGGVNVTATAPTNAQAGGLPVLGKELWVYPQVSPVPALPSSRHAVGTSGTTAVALPAGKYWVCVATSNAVGFSDCRSFQGVTVPAGTIPGGGGSGSGSGGGSGGGSGSTGGGTGSYRPLTPARVLDTRPGGTTTDTTFAGIGVRAAESTTQLLIAGRGGVPADATAVMLNVTAVAPGGTGFVTVSPCGVTRPNASSLNITAGRTIPNAVLATLGAGGTICLYTTASTHLLVDVSGYFPAGSGYRALTPARLLDTRPGGTTTDTAYAGIGFRAAGSTTEVQVTGRGSVPADATAAMLNVTATGPNSGGYVTVHPCGTVPNASNLNVTAGQTIPNAVLASLSPRGTVCLTTSVGTHLLIDVSGSFAAGAGYQPLLPARLFDSRPGGSTADGRFRAGGVRPAGSTTVVEITGRGGVPAGATAVMLNVTATEAGGDGYLTVYPCGTRPNASNLNVLTGDTIPNAVLATLATNGTICVYTDIATHLLIDVNGAFTG